MEGRKEAGREGTYVDAVGTGFHVKGNVLVSVGGRYVLGVHEGEDVVFFVALVVGQETFEAAWDQEGGREGGREGSERGLWEG
eukprot:evm.model.NODE_20163_length_1462_cov_12.048564.1